MKVPKKNQRLILAIFLTLQSLMKMICLQKVLVLELKMVTKLMSKKTKTSSTMILLRQKLKLKNKLPKKIQEMYQVSCQSDMDCYQKLCAAGIGHDAAGYATPQGLRNVLIISATPFQWKHIIGQRVCRRNTDETRIVLLKIWQELIA